VHEPHTDPVPSASHPARLRPGTASVGLGPDKSGDLDRQVRVQLPSSSSDRTAVCIVAGLTFIPNSRRFSLNPMNEQHRSLILLRHAKSAYPDGVVDHDRPLAPRGIREAGLAGDWLRANLPTIGQVLCSTAVRARETLTRARVDAPVRYAERLYGASPTIVIDEINAIADDVTTLLIVGHEPTISAVAMDLSGVDGTNNAAAESISAKFPTSGIALLHVAGRWNDLKPGGAALVDFHVPR
jgi:phosphohistidine phosphatase